MNKPTLTLLALLALMLMGCVDNRTPEQKQRAIDEEIASDITEFNYKEHRYIMYYLNSGNCSVAGLTHDPDCPCHEKGGSYE